MSIARSFEAQPPEVIGADGETRTPTPVKALAPEASVSTNSTTSAPKEVRIIMTLLSFVKHVLHFFKLFFRCSQALGKAIRQALHIAGVALSINNGFRGQWI